MKTSRIMKVLSHVPLLVGLLLSAGPVLAADPAVSNVRAAQQPGTKLVEISYDLSGSTTPVHVSLQVSSNGGTSFAVPVAALSGDVGTNISLGRNKRIVWNAGTDWNNQLSNTMKFRVTASDTPPAPEGFALIPAGSFQMGDQSNPLVGYNYERPVHSVYVSAFYMGKYEVTKEEWNMVRAWGLNNGYTDLAAGNGSYASKGANHPVHSITWYDMVKWCNARSQIAGLTPCYTVGGLTYKTGSSTPACNWSANGYRLPSEAEWEKAARGGVAGKNFPWGTDTITHSQANYYSSSSYAYDVSPTRGNHPSYTAGGTPYTAPVNSFTPNGYGLYNMSGNVWEWCWDWDGSYAAGSQTDPRGAASGSHRVLRGGSWYPDAHSCRVAGRSCFSPSGSNNGGGCRIARSSVP
jgi:sulfatase modifying factor 1